MDDATRPHLPDPRQPTSAFKTFCVDGLTASTTNASIPTSVHDHNHLLPRTTPSQSEHPASIDSAKLRPRSAKADTEAAPDS